MRFPRSGAAVLVIWEDVASFDKWAEYPDALDHVREVAHCRTLGWFKEVDNDCLVVISTGSFSNDGELEQVATIYRIPVGCVKGIYRLKTGAKL